MKIVLVFPPFYLEGMYNLPPLGLLNLATALKNSNHKITLIDFVLEIRKGTLKPGKDIYEHCAQRILEQDPSLVGLSAQCTTYPSLIQISERIKAAKPDVNIVIGGHNASFLDRISLERYPVIDAVVRGEGERTFKELVSAYGSGKDLNGINGITYRREGKIIQNDERELVPDLDDLPLPDYHFAAPLSEYRDACRLPRSIAILEVGRGCPHRCIYCSESIMWRRKTRTFSVPRLIKEMANLSENYGAECFLLAFDQFTAKRGFVKSFCHQVISHSLNHLPWYCISRLDSVDADLLGLMRKAGCESMCYGIDSGSKRTLSFIRKNIRQEVLYQRVVETADQGIIPTLSFVIGFPEENRQDIDETLMLALRSGIVGNNNPLIQLPTVLPGTDLHAAYGDRLVREVDTYFALGIEFDEGRRLKSDDDLISSDPMIFSSFYNLPCPGLSLEELNLIATYFPLIIQFYSKTFLLLCLECNKYVSELFMEWLAWLKMKLDRKKPELSPQDCYLHFGEFVSAMLSKKKTVRTKHIAAILEYENLGIETGKSKVGEGKFKIELQDPKSLKPKKNKGVIVEEFDFYIPGIILDLKAGVFREQYSPQKTLLLFKQENNFLDVSEINSFVKDLLELCDGEKTVDIISKTLYDNYGEAMKPAAFFDSCVEAITLLGNQHLFDLPETEDPRERR